MKAQVSILTRVVAMTSLLSLNTSATADTLALARTADAIIVLEVSFVPYGNLVLLKEVLTGDRSLLRSPEEYLGDCLPGKAEVRAQAQAGSDTAKYYQAALERAGYSAVLLVKRSEGGSTPICDAARQDPAHWEQHPEHAGWRAQIDSLLSHR